MTIFNNIAGQIHKAKSQGYTIDQIRLSSQTIEQAIREYWTVTYVHPVDIFQRYENELSAQHQMEQIAAIPQITSLFGIPSEIDDSIGDLVEIIKHI